MNGMKGHLYRFSQNRTHVNSPYKARLVDESVWQSAAGLEANIEESTKEIRVRLKRSLFRNKIKRLDEDIAFRHVLKWTTSAFKWTPPSS